MFTNDSLTPPHKNNKSTDSYNTLLYRKNITWADGL